MLSQPGHCKIEELTGQVPEMAQGSVSSSRYIAHLPPQTVTDCLQPAMASHLPAIPAKRYFTIGEVADLCDVKPHVLRYWEQEFAQLKPMKRRGNRRYYQHHEVLMVRRIRELLYEQGFTISGARNRLRELASGHGGKQEPASPVPEPDVGPGQGLGPGRGGFLWKGFAAATRTRRQVRSRRRPRGCAEGSSR